MSAMDDWIKENCYKYQMTYTINVPKASGLKNLFRMAEELYTEMGLDPDDSILLQDDIKSDARILYNREDAKRLLNGDISEEDYLNLHISGFTKQGITLVRSMEEFPDHPGKLFSKSE